MGNSPNGQTDNLLANLTTEYEQLKPDARGMVLLHKQNHSTYLLKEYTFGSEILFRNKEKQLRMQIEHGFREHIISPVKVEAKTFSSFCSTSFKIYAIFEYPQVSLKEQISARQNENKSFEEGELWSILQSCTNALSQLNPMVSLNPNEIFINPDGHLKIIHDDLIDENFRAVLNDQIYYAPEKLNNFNKLDSELTLRKESIFSMGMTILEAAQLSSVSPCYNFNDCYFSETNLMEMLEIVAEKYSPEFGEILGNVLEPNPNRRASLMEVQKMLDSFWSLEDTQQEIEKPEQEEVEEESKGLSYLAQKDMESQPEQFPLTDKCMNKSIAREKPEKPEKSEIRRTAFNNQKVAVPQHLPAYKLEPAHPVAPVEVVPITPKNPITTGDNCLYTDPKLLEMIKKDLQDINQLKQSAFYETSKYTFMYPQTESILNSIKGFETEPKATPPATQQFIDQPLGISSEQVHRPSMLKRNHEAETSKPMMKKQQAELIFTIESYEDGRRYEGTTLNDQKHGKGKLLFEDGAYYEGEFKQDKMNGRGVLYYSQNSPAYDGEWLNDQFHGQGVLFNERPEELNCEYDFRDMSEVEDYWIRYEGQFHFDNKQGNGTLFLTNGEYFEGQFAEDYLNGEGKYHCLSGEVIEGQWESNILVSVFSPQQ